MTSPPSPSNASARNATAGAYAARTLRLVCGPRAETLSARGRERLRGVFADDDATGQLPAAWEGTEDLRDRLSTCSLEQAREQRRILIGLVEAALAPETRRLPTLHRKRQRGSSRPRFPHR